MKMTGAEPAGVMYPSWKALLATSCLLLVLQAGPALGSGACLPRCSCNDTGGVSVNCSGRGFVSVPAANTLNPVRLNLDKNRIQALAGRNFAGLSNLKDLSLSGNDISTLPAMAFGPLRALNALNLANNNIRGWSDGTFLTLNHLRVLDLTGNRISALNSSSFVGLVNLRELYLSNNSISRLNGSVFASMTYILKLELDWNPITQLAANFGAGLRRLANLNLNHNKLRVIPADAFYGATIQAVHLKHCKELTTIATNAFRGAAIGDLYIMNNAKLQEIAANSFNGAAMGTLHILHNPRLSSYNARAFHNSSIPRFDLRHNSLMEISPYIVHNLPHLKLMLLAGNRLKAHSSACGLFDLLDFDAKTLLKTDYNDWKVKDLDQYDKLKCRHGRDCLVDPSGKQDLFCACPGWHDIYNGTHCLNNSTTCHIGRSRRTTICCAQGTTFNGYECAKPVTTPPTLPTTIPATQPTTTPTTQPTTTPTTQPTTTPTTQPTTTPTTHPTTTTPTTQPRTTPTTQPTTTPTTQPTTTPPTQPTTTPTTQTTTTTITSATQPTTNPITQPTTTDAATTQETEQPTATATESPMQMVGSAAVSLQTNSSVLVSPTVPASVDPTAERISRAALARLESEVKKLGDDQAEIWKEMSSLEHYVEGMLKKVMVRQTDHVMRVLDENEERQFMLEERLSALKENHSESLQDHHARIQSHINTLKLNISALHNKLHKNQHHKSDVMDTSQGNSTTSSMPSAIWLFDPLNKAADVEVAPDGRIARSMTGAGGAVIGRNGYLTGKHQWIIRVHGIGHSVWLGVTHVPKPPSHTFFDSKTFYGWSNHKECARATSDVSIFPGAMKWHNNQLLRLTLDLSQQRLLLRHEGLSVEHSISLGHRGEPLYLYSYMGYGWNVEIVKYTMLSML